MSKYVPYTHELRLSLFSTRLVNLISLTYIVLHKINYYITIQLLKRVYYKLN